MSKHHYTCRFGVASDPLARPLLRRAGERVIRNVTPQEAVIQFDARAAKLLKPGEHIMVDGCLGLRLVARASVRTWIYRYKSPVDGNMRQRRIGSWPGVSVGQAMAEWEKLKDQRAAGVDPAMVVKGERVKRLEVVKAAREGVYTVRRLVDDYLVGHIDIHRKAKGKAEIHRLFDRHLGKIETLPAATLKRSQAFDFLEGLLSTPVQAGAIRGELGAAWDHALDAGRLPEESPNWWRLIMRGKLRSKGRMLLGKSVGPLKRVLSDVETGQVIRWLPNFTALADDALTLYLWTCTRGAEIMAMEYSEITEEVDGLWWTVPKAKTKSARHDLATDLRVPLVGRTEAIVRRRMQAYGKGYLFPSRGKFGYSEQKSIGVAVHYYMPYCKSHPEHVRPRLPVTKWAPHDLRRTGRTLLAGLGCPDSVAEAILGHMQPGVLGIYNRHMYDRERRLWLTKLDAKLEQLANLK